MEAGKVVREGQKKQQQQHSHLPPSFSSLVASEDISGGRWRKGRQEVSYFFFVWKWKFAGTINNAILKSSRHCWSSKSGGTSCSSKKKESFFFWKVSGKIN